MKCRNKDKENTLYTHISYGVAVVFARHAHNVELKKKLNERKIYIYGTAAK